MADAKDEFLLVTGGAGFVGSHVVGELTARGHRVVVVDNLRTGHRASVSPATEFHQLDLADLPGLEALLQSRRFTGILHFAALSLVGESMTDPMLYLGDNTVCYPNPCLSITGACCMYDGTCVPARRVEIQGSSLVQTFDFACFAMSEPAGVEFSFGFGVDFADIFEARGMTRARRGEFIAPAMTEATVTHGYIGLDGATRLLHTLFEPAPTELSEHASRHASIFLSGADHFRRAAQPRDAERGVERREPRS